ncbi:MAG: pyruvate, phosphate dikinase [Bacteroidales bacterium]|nr:pyruvate, phosphate dikinase [Bacteroidales bacterium]
MSRLESKKDFDNFSGLPLSEKYGQVSALKLVYDLKTQKLYFINSRYFKYHHEFCGRKIENEVELEYFNRINYSNDSKRKYLLANINYFKSLGIYALEISPADLMPEEDILRLRNIVSNATYIGDSLHLLLNSARLQDLSMEFERKIPILKPSDIYRNLNYQAIGKFKNNGILNFINDLESEIDNINPMDIVVINETPLFLPKVAGIIVTEFQTPLSHLTILGQNRKIPIAAYKQAFQDSVLLNLNHKKVCLNVLGDTFKIEPIDKLKPINQTQRQIKLKYNLEVDSIISIENFNKRSFKYAGNKAGNFGILYQLSQKHNFKVPECAFVIPFYFYNNHILNSLAKQVIESLILNADSINKDTLKMMLKSIRKEIRIAPLDTVLLKSIDKKVLTNNNYKRFRFRSSTNAEDAKRFSGAGLYASKTGIFNDEKKTFEKAIKKVWASLWSYEAYSEREYYNINHKDVYMGILVHRSFPNEEVNGVAITKNLYRPDNYGFVINSQLGDESVVKPKEGNISDQFICYPDNVDNIYKNKNTIDIITQSNLNDNKLVMTTDEIQNLANQLDAIKKYFINHTFTSKSYFDFGLDIEFKLDKGDRKLYIKQVRLYND